MRRLAQAARALAEGILVGHCVRLTRDLALADDKIARLAQRNTALRLENRSLRDRSAPWQGGIR